MHGRPGLPSPFTQADWRAGYVYELAFRQFEVSDTSVFDRPQAGRMWFESVIRDQLDIGRPHQIALIFQRRVSRRTPGRFRTRVLTEGVDPTLCCYYKSSRLKQYFTLVRKRNRLRMAVAGFWRLTKESF